MANTESIKLGLRLALFDILIPLVKLGLLFYSIVQLFQHGDMYWGLATIGAILIPGLLELLYWLLVCCFDPEKGSSSDPNPWFWILLFNPITFPFSVILWHGYQLRDLGKYKENFAMFLVLNCLQSFTESAAIAVLQLVIIITNWNHTETHQDVVTEAITAIVPDQDKREIARWVHVASAGLAMVGLAKDFARHHFHELSGKEGVPNLGVSFKALLVYLTFIICRLPSLVLLALIFRHYFFVILLIFILCNFIMSLIILGMNAYKSLWTSFGSVLAPICFVARAEVPNFSHPGRAFTKYYVWNSFTFFVVTLSAFILANVYYGMRDSFSTSPDVDINKFLNESFTRIPFVDLQCEPNYAGCPYVLSAIGVAFTVAEIIVLKIVEFTFPQFLGHNLPALSSL